ncbi:hypothetical protein [Nocardia testacea]|uniref:hypothetical protein n=1 Tax=Nocardia testacea TaxID=248551 RepID=UPI0033C9A0CF
MSEPLDPRASTTLYQAPVGQAVCLPALYLTTTFRFEENDMTMINDLDAINADLMGGGGVGRSAFGRDAKQGDQISGEIIAVTRRQRLDRETGQPLFWVNRKPSTVTSGQPVLDSIVTVQTDLQDDEADDGLRALYLDREMQAALRTAVRKAGAGGIEIGGVLDGFMLVGTNDRGGRVYDVNGYRPPSA